jgi:xylulokinase
VVLAYAKKPDFDPGGSLHTFCHAVPGAWHQMGVTLAAGGAFQWLRDTIFDRETLAARKRQAEPYTIMTDMAAKIPPGSEGLFFLPYLSGERTPHADPRARGTFFGLSLAHNKKHFARAVMEGVSYSLRDCLELVQRRGVRIREIRVSGGGARSQLWRQMLADVFNTPVVTINMDEGPAFGAALLAAVGTGAYASVPEACRATISITNRRQPDKSAVGIYEAGYAFYRSLYPALQERFRELEGVRNTTAKNSR